MNRIVLIASLILASHASEVRAQSSVYVAGDLFLDMQRGSGATSPTASTLSSTVGGGGVRLGAFLASRWTLEIGVDGSAAAESSFSIGSDSVSAAAGRSVTLSPIPIVISIDERVRTRTTATAVLLGYHPPSRGRLTAGFKGGINFVRRSSTLTATTTYTVTDPRLAPALTLPSPASTTSSGVNFSTAAILSAELAIALTPHASVVPEFRAFGFGGQLFLRPGAELRWLF